MGGGLKGYGSLRMGTWELNTGIWELTAGWVVFMHDSDKSKVVFRVSLCSLMGEEITLIVWKADAQGWLGRPLLDSW